MGRLDEAVLDRLEHRLHVRERRPEVVARPGHQLRPGVEQVLEPLRHRVERLRQRGQLPLLRCGAHARSGAAPKSGSRCRIGARLREIERARLSAAATAAVARRRRPPGS